MDNVYYCEQCGERLTKDEVARNYVESQLSYPGEWDSDRWLCDKCVDACQPN